jgi:hypothetical protein
MSQRFVVPALLLAVLLSGCRTYGGHGSEDAVIGQFAAMPEWASQESNRLAGDRQALEEAAAVRPALAPFIARVAELSVELEQMAAGWSAVAGAGHGATSYRDLHHELGAMISERQVWQNAYRALARDVAAVALGEADGPRAPSRYQVAPVHYERLASTLDDVRIREIVASLR